MGPLLEAALSSAVAEMDGRSTDPMPAPLALLRERVVSAIENVSLYNDLYGPYGRPPANLDEFIHWYSGLPVISRAEIEECPLEDRLSRLHASRSLVKKRTSGSTGIPLTLYIDERVASFRSWRFRRPHFNSGDTSPETIAFIFPERFRRDRQERVKGNGNDGVVRQRSRKEKSYSTLTDALKSPQLIYQEIADKRPTTLVGYASAISRLSEWMGRERSLPSVKRIWTTSEVLTPSGRDSIRRAFGFEPRESYASAEFGFMGWQETPGGPFVLETDRLVFQKVEKDCDSSLSSGELCHVVVSDLLNDVTPLLRYDIGDLAIMSMPASYSAECYESLEELRGKTTDILHDAAGVRIEPFALLGCLKETLGAAQYRLICVSPSLFVLQYRPAQSLPVQLEAALDGLREIIGPPTQVIAQSVSAIKREKSGKLRPIVNVSKVPRDKRDRLLQELDVSGIQYA